MATDLSKYKFNHSMIRVKDPVESVKFYEFLGMKLIDKSSHPDAKFDLYFLAYDSPGALSHGAHRSNREGIVELTHNYGTENDTDYKVATGNSEPGKGFGHLCISVDNIQAACKRIEDAGYKFQKKLTDGRMHNIAFVLDPNGYWIEIIAMNDVEATENVKETDVNTYRMNHTMIRVKDIEKSLDFYQDVMGMKLLKQNDFKEAGFSLYFLAYGSGAGSNASAVNPRVNAEGILELTYNHGSEKDDSVKYHSGNTEPQGFGHIAVSVDDIEAACQRFEDKKVNFKKRLTDGRMKSIAFILDPDGYWIEIIPNQTLKPRANA
ncbi:glyoxylase I [Pseudovirgaria hyperparasitica]|uniref:Lactoylglutathione lyase n=1 Tax=Pseudovirgaria hyperparasitica TaxID=470096 RepID=A0A6A6WEC1_9PEZI|nr:glyoxylase I [Pseudovirgaria hyperparasitica]KAF2760226.1 glyoxylase I [Pseudovirgaria hyperparasitica]